MELSLKGLCRRATWSRSVCTAPVSVAWRRCVADCWCCRGAVRVGKCVDKVDWLYMIWHLSGCQLFVRCGRGRSRVRCFPCNKNSHQKVEPPFLSHVKSCNKLLRRAVVGSSLSAVAIQSRRRLSETEPATPTVAGFRVQPHRPRARGDDAGLIRHSCGSCALHGEERAHSRRPPPLLARHMSPCGQLKSDYHGDGALRSHRSHSV